MRQNQIQALAMYFLGEEDQVADDKALPSRRYSPLYLFRIVFCTFYSWVIVSVLRLFVQILLLLLHASIDNNAETIFVIVVASSLVLQVSC